MATILRTPALFLPPSTLTPKPRFSPSLSVKPRLPWHHRPQLKLSRAPDRPLRLSAAAAQGDATETEEEVLAQQIPSQEESDEEIIEDSSANDGVVAEEVAEEEVASVITPALQSYKEALKNGDESTVAEIESFLLSIEEEKNTLAKTVATLLEEQSIERDRVLRISADFDNFRKRTDRERQSLMTNVKGEVVESLLPVLDNFERAKSQIKVETEGEEKINNSYQSIYKQFFETLSSLGVEAVETVGKVFDPLLHEAIMQEESEEFEEGIVIMEFRKGFKLGERLLRPAMVKVSSGPGPAKTEADDDTQVPIETSEETIEESEDDA